MPSEERTERTSRKRQRTSAVNGEKENDDTKKQRGRPRVEGQDETAADRRRTQIRLAQRAYRQRKETTITNLRDQVRTLQSTIDEMNRAFLHFNDQAVTSGVLQIKPELAHELKTTTEQFIHLAKASTSFNSNASGDGHESGPEDAVVKVLSARHATEPRSVSKSPEQKHHSEGPRSVDLGLGYVQIFEESGVDVDPTTMDSVEPSPPNHYAQPAAPTSSSGLAFSEGANSTSHHPPSASSSSPSSSSATATKDRRSADAFSTAPRSTSSGAVTAATNYYASVSTFTEAPTPAYSSIESPIPLIPTLFKNTTIQSPYTFSLEETSFARRLQRAALERGFHLLATANLRPSAFHRAFRLSLLYNTPDALLAKFRALLTKSTSEPLEFYHTPFIHLGGAGTHYSNGRVTNGFIVKPGPLMTRRARLESTESGADAGVDLEIDMEEYAGDWFDSNDVEGYLEEKGVTVSPHASFAEAYVSADDGLFKLLSGLNPDAFGRNHPSPNGAARKTGSETPSMSSASTAVRTPRDETAGEDSSSSSTNGANNASTTAFPTFGFASLDDGAGFWDVEGPGGIFDSGPQTPDFLSSGWMADPSITNGFEWMGGPGAFAESVVAMENAKLAAGVQTDVRLPSPPASDTTTSVVDVKRTVTIDVAKMIDELIRAGICLGRAPGFRKRDVDRALSSAVIQVI